MHIKIINYYKQFHKSELLDKPYQLKTPQFDQSFLYIQNLCKKEKVHLSQGKTLLNNVKSFHYS